MSIDWCRMVCAPSWLSVLYAVPVIGACTFAAAPPFDSATYRGKRLAYWRTLLKHELWNPQFYYPPVGHPLQSPDVQALPVLMCLAEDLDVGVRLKAIRLIGRLRSHGGPAVTVLAKALRDPDDTVKIAALLAIKQMGPSASNAKGEIEKLLSNRCPEIASLASTAIRAIQPGK